MELFLKINFNRKSPLLRKEMYTLFSCHVEYGSNFKKNFFNIKFTCWKLGAFYWRTLRYSDVLVSRSTLLFYFFKININPIRINVVIMKPSWEDRVQFLTQKTEFSLSSLPRRVSSDRVYYHEDLGQIEFINTKI